MRIFFAAYAVLAVTVALGLAAVIVAELFQVLA